MNLVSHDNAALHSIAETVSDFDDSLSIFVNELAVFMYENGGVGIAAPQVGVNKKIAIVDHSYGADVSALIVMINPEIAFIDGDDEMGMEGCLSYPDVVLPIRRRQRCTILYTDLLGDRIKLEATGFQARIIQHEIDHLNGVTFVDKVGPLTKRQLKKDLK